MDVRNGKLKRLSDRVRGLLAHSKWLKPLSDRPYLWRWSRRTVAVGAAIGVFFGFLIPLGQIPASAILATYLRANLPMAVAGTWITNPLTTPAFLYGMYRVGAWLTGSSEPVLAADTDLLSRVGEIGTALLVGIPVSATVLALLTYGLVQLTWLAWVARRRARLFRWARTFVRIRRLARACRVGAN